MLAGSAFEIGEVGFLIASKACPARSGLSAAFQSVSDFDPSRVVGGEIAGGEGGDAGCRGGHDAHGAAQHQGWRGDLAPGGPTLMMAVAAEQMFEVFVGARQVGHGVAVEMAGAIAGGDLHEMIDGGGQGSSLVAPRTSSHDQAVVARLHDRGGMAGGIAQDVGRRVQPAMGFAHVRPQGRGALQTAPDQIAQPPERLAQPPFSATRSRLRTIASNRPFSFRPGAASGGRPSSVSAERTAAQ